MACVDRTLLLEQLLGNGDPVGIAAFPDLSNQRKNPGLEGTHQPVQWSTTPRLEQCLAAELSMDQSSSGTGDLDDIVSGIRGSAASSRLQNCSQFSSLYRPLTGQRVRSVNSQQVNSAMSHLTSEDSSQFDLLLQLVRTQAKQAHLEGFPAMPSIHKKQKLVDQLPSASRSQQTGTQMAPQGPQASGTPMALLATQLSGLSGSQAQHTMFSDHGLSPEEKRLKRKESNREAARRMRKRHADRVAELQAQVIEVQRAHSDALSLLQEAQERITELEASNRQLAAREQGCQAGRTSEPEAIASCRWEECAKETHSGGDGGVKRGREDVSLALVGSHNEPHFSAAESSGEVDLLDDTSLDDLFSTGLFDLPVF